MKIFLWLLNHFKNITMRQLKIQNNSLNTNLPSLGILTHVEELTRYEMIYIYHHLKNGAILDIEKDENRAWDENSSMVSFKGFKLGYVSSKTSAIIKKKMAQGYAVSASVKSLNKEKYLPLNAMDIQVYVRSVA